MIVLWLQKWLGAAALKIVWIGAAALAVLAVLFGVRSAGRNAERIEHLERALANSIKARRARIRVDSEPDPIKRLRDEWSRD